MTTAVQDFREMSDAHLGERVRGLQQELLQLREDVAFGKEKNHAKISILKRDLARAKTILRQKGAL